MTLEEQIISMQSAAEQAFENTISTEEFNQLKTQVDELATKLDGQSTILLQIGMMSAKPPEVPDAPPEDLPTDTIPIPDADTLKNMMSGAVPPEIP